MKRLLRILMALMVLIPVASLSWLSLTESGLHWAFKQASPYLPAELSIKALSGRLIGPIIANGVEYQQDDARLKAEKILVDWQPLALLMANISIDRLQVQSLNIILSDKTKTEPDPVVALPDIKLPWRITLGQAQVDDIKLTQAGQNYQLKQIKLNASTLFNEINIGSLSISSDSFKLNVKGDLKPGRNYRHDLELDWQTQLATGVVIKGRGQLAGNLKTSRLKQQLQGPLQLTLEAEVSDLLTQLNWQAKVDVSQFDISKLDKQWPALTGKLKLDGQGDLTTATVSGRLNGNYPELGALDAEFKLHRLSDNRLQLEQLKLLAPANNTQLNVSGQWQPDSQGGNMELALNWHNLKWPMRDNPWFDSTIGSGTIKGTLDHYQIELNTDRPWPQVPPSHWYAQAEGNLNGLTFHTLRVSTMKGEAVAKGKLDWSPQLSWKARIKASGIDPASLWPQWPGQLNASLTSSGRLDNGQWFVDANISQLNGQLRNYPVTLSSQLRLRGDTLEIDNLDFSSANSRASLRGVAGDSLKLNWSIESTDLAELYPQAKGELRALGNISGPRLTPLIEASINGKSLRVPDYELGTVDGQLAIDWQQWRKIDIKLTAQSLNLNGYALKSLSFNADTRQLQLKAISDIAAADIKLKGTITANGWRGHLQQASIQSQRYGDWQLKAPTKIEISQQSLNTETQCWNSNQDASICASVNADNANWQTQLSMNKIPLLLLGPWLPPDLKLEGLADVHAQLQFQNPDQLLGQVQIDLAPGAISYPLLEGERDRWEYRKGKVDLLLGKQEIKISSDIAMSNGDRFNGWLKLPNAKLLALDRQNQPLQANLRLNIHDLGIIEAVAPEVYDLRGEVDVNLSVDGTLSQPKLSGNAQLLNAALRIPRLGLTINQLSFKGQSEGPSRFKFQMAAHSGEGHLTILGSTLLHHKDGWPTEVSIKGEQFEISSIPEARVQISPDLNVKIQKHAIDIKGGIHIPYAKLQPKDITTAARVSNDAVIVGDEQAIEPKWSIHTRIRLTLGERVNFFGFGFDGRLGGSLLLEDEPGQLTRATGEINIPEGRYRAYGQRLDVEHGRLLYTGGPISNPGLDLRAVRHSNNVTAGLKVKGSLNQPQLELFSIPAMGQTDALSYLLLGRPMENASGEEGAMMAKAALALGLSGGDRLARLLGDQFGLDEMRVESSDTGDQASLVVGRYLSPKVYVSYGVGLIESINTFTVRYQISDKWQIKAESGEAQGADILYTIER